MTDKERKITRRKFIQSSAAGLAAVSASGLFLRNRLGENRFYLAFWGYLAL